MTIPTTQAPLKLWARFPLDEDDLGNPRYVDILTTDGKSPGRDGLTELQCWIETVGRPMAAWNERQAHRCVALALEGMAAKIGAQEADQAPASTTGQGATEESPRGEESQAPATTRTKGPRQTLVNA